MFGRTDNQQPDQAAQAAEPAVAADTTPAPSTDSWQHPGAPIDPTPTAPASVSPTFGSPSLPSTSTPTPAPASSESSANELLDIKQEALNQLSPLVGHLDQTPEEKFRTTMMMIQASDNQNMVKDAYEAAKAIPDEKARAQALLDVINEINYFTQHKDS